MSHFAKVARVPGDPILGLLDAYRNDPRATSWTSASVSTRMPRA